MTNHIEQLMKAAGVECSTMCKPIGANCKAGCDNCERRKVFYPSFTPEKQLELIKLIVNTKKVECFYIQKRKNDFKISCLLETTNFAASVIATDPVMEVALAKLLIKLLTKNELDKSEVRRILEND